MYNTNAKNQLKEKIDYELYLLDFISNYDEYFVGNKNITTIELDNDSEHTHVKTKAHDTFSSSSTIINKVMPLTFISSFKVLDMIFEWILHKNYNNVPWTFTDKIRKIENNKTSITYPSIFTNNQYLMEYSFTLYSNMKWFRNEVVHNNNFNQLNDKIEIIVSNDKQTPFYKYTNLSSHKLVLSKKQLGYLVRYIVALVNLLINNLTFDSNIDKQLKHHLDIIEIVHNKNTFNQGEPILIDVVLKVKEHNGKYFANLDFIKNKIEKIYASNVDVNFNLTIKSSSNDTFEKYFSYDNIPSVDILEINKVE